jgi:transglutaminase/protease-like cytokinesis protein 3
MTPIRACFAALLVCLSCAGCTTPAPPAPATAAPKARPMIAGDPKVFAGMDFSAIDERAAGVPASQETSMARLVSYLLDGTRSEVERVRALWVWEATHIDYDARSYVLGDIPDLDPEEVFILRKGVCFHYSILFERLAGLAGIPARLLTGLATGYPKSILLGDTRHAWNAVRIDGAWYLLDVTWSAGHLDENFQFHRTEPDEAFFLTDPAVFLRSHLPEDPFWQLLPRPISADTFIEIAPRGD